MHKIIYSSFFYLGLSFIFGMVYTILVYLFPSLETSYGFVRAFTSLYVVFYGFAWFYTMLSFTNDDDDIVIRFPKIYLILIFLIISVLLLIGFIIAKKYVTVPNILYPVFDLKNFAECMILSVIGILVFFLTKFSYKILWRKDLDGIAILSGTVLTMAVFLLTLVGYKYVFVVFHLLLIKTFG